MMPRIILLKQLRDAASETCALDTIGATFVRDVEPGEIVSITKDGIESDRSMCLPDAKKQARCVFEYIYFARPDSVFDGVSVYHSRIHAGRCLAIDSPVDADHRGRCAGIRQCSSLGLLYGVRHSVWNRICEELLCGAYLYQAEAEQPGICGNSVKLNVLREAVAGKRVIMIDDSIVRGTTSHLIVRMLRDAGAKEVHVKVSAPPFLHPCYFGTDIPSRRSADRPADRTIEEIRQIIGADSLSYLKMERLSELAEGLPICTALL